MLRIAHDPGADDPPASSGASARGWTAADLQAFFATGVAKQGSVFGEMQIAQLANYLRVTWGGQPGDVTADKVKSSHSGRCETNQTRAPRSASWRCSVGHILATASSPARIDALRWLKSLLLIALRFGRITALAYLSSS